jgi:L-lysine 2,3-aminomutase
MITASITYYVKVKMNVFDWLIRNNKNDVIQYARTGFLNKIDSISNSDLDTKELLLQEIPDKYRHLIDENDEEFNMSLRVIKLLSEVQFTVKGENIDFIIKDTDENLKKIQNQLYDKMFK